MLLKLYLPDSDEPRPGGDFVTEGVAYLRCSKGELALVEFQQPLEVDEDSLSSLWSEKPRKDREVYIDNSQVSDSFYNYKYVFTHYCLYWI